MSDTYQRLWRCLTLAKDYELDYLDFVAYAIDEVGELDIDKSEIANTICEIVEREIEISAAREEIENEISGKENRRSNRTD